MARTMFLWLVTTIFCIHFCYRVIKRIGPEITNVYCTSIFHNLTSTNSSTQVPFYLVVLQLIIAAKLSGLEQFENQATNNRIASRKG